MKKIIFCDAAKNVVYDIQTSLMLDDYPFVGVATSDIYTAYDTMAKYPDATIFISDRMLEAEGFDSARFTGRTVYGYASDKEGIEAIQKYFPCIGLIKSSEKLLETAGMPSINVMKPIGKNSPPVRREQTAAKPPVTHDENGTMSAPRAENKPQEAPKPEYTEAPAANIPNAPNGFTPEQMQAMFVMMQQIMGSGQTVPASAPVQPDTAQTVPAYPTNTAQTVHEQPVQKAEPAPAQPEEVDEDDEVEVSKGASRLQKRVNERKKQEADKALKSAIETGDKPEDKKTVVVTAYSAKGGVGKTTIAAETAVYLALTSNGRRKFRVCIVDYNIDFGDVASVLKMDEKGNNMVGWASVIDEMIDEGQRPEDIRFTRKEMEENYLQQMEGVGLYCLVAPIAHEDSMYISSDALSVMLRNIIENGGFDYVICDAGNNTRDGSIVAIDNSDYVLLIATQDVATANCNAAVVRTIEKTGFDISKIHMIINNIISTRESGVSVQEVEETFPYPCICRIKRMPDVIKANNLGRPLVLTPTHEYTKQIQKVVAFITSGEIVEEEEKKGLFSGFFKKK